MISAICVGDNCIDYYLPPIDLHFTGGNAVNVAVYLRRSGVKTAYLGVIGDDQAGQAMKDALAAEELDISRIKTLPGRTAETHIHLSSNNEREFVFEDLGPARGSLSLDQEDLAFIFAHRLVHNTWQGGTSAYLPVFRSAGSLLISQDYGERYSSDFVDRTIRYVDVAFFSLPEEMVADAAELARGMQRDGTGLVVVTMGSKGSLAFDGITYTRQEAMSIDAIDTLGAGDAYIGAFLACWLLEKSLQDCMANASRMAANACHHYGGWEQPVIKT